MAQFRCDEISSVALQEFNDQAKGYRKPIESGHVVADLGEMMHGWRRSATCEYGHMRMYWFNC